MAVTIQKELADRIAASPRTKDYSALSVWVQSQARVELVRVMPPEVFWPRPKVHSAILRIIPDESLRRRIPNVPFFHRFVRAIFFHRRKFLRANLIAAFKGLLEKPDVDQVLEPLSIGPEARSEELTVEQMITLSEAFRARVGDEALK
jgi:16S rRNA (adenine1518-N6/adenine1519-N6)-dimethyltransferase